MVNLILNNKKFTLQSALLVKIRDRKMSSVVLWIWQSNIKTQYLSFQEQWNRSTTNTFGIISNKYFGFRRKTAFRLELKSREENVHKNVVKALWKKGGDTSVWKQPFVVHGKPLTKKCMRKQKHSKDFLILAPSGDSVPVITVPLNRKSLPWQWHYNPFTFRCRSELHCLSKPQDGDLENLSFK